MSNIGLWRPGDPYAICDRCGFRFHLSDLKKEWTGAMVCAKDFDERNPQDLLRPVKEKIIVENARPEPADVFVSPYEITPDDL